MASRHSVAVCYLWDSMTPIEQASYVHSVLGNGVGVTDNHANAFDTVKGVVGKEKANKINREVDT